MRTINDWLSEYGESHRNPTNKTIHWVCVPSIFFSVVGLLFLVKIPLSLGYAIQLNLAVVVLLFAVIYYMRLSKTLWIGMLLYALLCLFVLIKLEQAGVSILHVCIFVFVIAWIGQFIGHKIEGRKPSFFKDLQFLLIGPAWLMNFIYKRLGIKI